MKFTEITISTATEAQELVAGILWNYTSYGVAISVQGVTADSSIIS